MITCNAVDSYQVAVTGYLAAGTVLTTSAVNSLLYSNKGTDLAAATGLIILTVVTVCAIPDVFPSCSSCSALTRSQALLDFSLWVNAIN